MKVSGFGNARSACGAGVHAFTAPVSLDHFPGRPSADTLCQLMNGPSLHPVGLIQSASLLGGECNGYFTRGTDPLPRPRSSGFLSLRGSPHRLQPGTSPHADPTSRWSPCPPENCDDRLQVRLGCVRLSPSCPFRLLHTCSLSPGPRGITPASGYDAPHSRAHTMPLCDSPLGRYSSSPPPGRSAALQARTATGSIGTGA